MVSPIVICRNLAFDAVPGCQCFGVGPLRCVGKKSKQPAARAFSLATPATPGGLADVGPVMISFGHVHDISMQASQPAALDRRASQNPGTGSSLTQVGVCNGPQFFHVARGFRRELSMLRHSTMDIRIGPSPGLRTPLSCC